MGGREDISVLHTEMCSRKPTYRPRVRHRGLPSSSACRPTLPPNNVRQQYPEPNHAPSLPKFKTARGLTGAMSFGDGDSRRTREVTAFLTCCATGNEDGTFWGRSRRLGLHAIDVGIASDRRRPTDRWHPHKGRKLARETGKHKLCGGLRAVLVRPAPSPCSRTSGRQEKAGESAKALKQLCLLRPKENGGREGSRHGVREPDGVGNALSARSICEVDLRVFLFLSPSIDHYAHRVIPPRPRRANKLTFSRFSECTTSSTARSFTSVGDQRDNMEVVRPTPLQRGVSVVVVEDGGNGRKGCSRALEPGGRGKRKQLPEGACQ
ncbi:hypothetical protein OF83DRAFT_1086611 [Amylostereum chailletii]|nr:hypothetical protein OF83DRAFT_1086611 [Amylostereum chailletii]